MADLPQCDAYGFIYDQHGGAAADVLVTLKRVEDASGHPILLSPLTTLTDSAGQYFFTLPQAARAYITARATTLYDCNGGIVHLVPSSPSGPLAPIIVPPAEAAGFVVQPPLFYSASVLSIDRSSRASDGYLAAEDFIRFDDSNLALSDYVPLAGATMTGFLTLVGNPLSTYHAATKNYVDTQINAIPLPPPTPPAGIGSELQYRLNATTFGAIPSSYGPGLWNMPTVKMSDSLEIDGYLSMRSQAGGTQFVVTEPGMNPVSIFYAINTAGNPRYIYFGRGNPFGTPPLTVPQYMMFYTGAVGTEDVRRMYLSPLGSLVINQQALANQAAALTVNQNGNTAFSKALQVNGIGEMSADPTTALGIATKQYVDSHSFVLNLNAPYPWTGSHSWTNIMLLKSGGMFLGEYSNGNPAGIFWVDEPTNTVVMGPTISPAYGFDGTKVEWLSGSGLYTDSQPGTIGVNYLGLGTFDFIGSLINVRGSITLANTYGTGNSLTLANDVALRCKYTNGNAANMLRISNPLNVTLIGPETDVSNSTAGTRVDYLCGTGQWSSVSYGACTVNAAYPQPFTWDFMAHINCRGQLKVSGEFTSYAAPALLLGINVPLQTTCPDGPVRAFYDDGTYYHIGPEYSTAGGAVHGRYVLFQCGMGGYDGAPGFMVHGPLTKMFMRLHMEFAAGYGYYLTLGQDPASPLHATTKQYVDRLALGNAVLATYSATFATNAALGKYFRIPLTGALTLAAPTGMVDGQTITWEFVQDTAGNHAVTLDAVFVSGDAGPFTATQTANARSYVVAAYHASSGKWDVLAQSGGYL